MEHFNSFVGIVRGRKFHEGKSAGFPREFIHHHVDGRNAAGCRKEILQILIHRLIRKIANEQAVLAHRGIGLIWVAGEV